MAPPPFRPARFLRIAAPPPYTNFQGVAAPATGLIVKFRPSAADGKMHWQDEANTVWDSAVNLSLPDKDVFVINAAANPPVQQAGAGGFFAGVGTVLFNMVVNPVSGAVYVSNTDAQNDHRFEGPGTYAGHSLRGHLAESHITVLKRRPGSAASPEQAHQLQFLLRGQSQCGEREEPGVSYRHGHLERRPDALCGCFRLQQNRDLQHRRA